MKALFRPSSGSACCACGAPAEVEVYAELDHPPVFSRQGVAPWFVVAPTCADEQCLARSVKWAETGAIA